MASETKRHNAGSKTPVALPNSGPPPPSPTVSLDTALGGTMGARVRVTTAPPISATYEGLLYTADVTTNLIVLSIPPSPAPSSSPVSNSALPTNTFKLLPLSQLTSFTILSPPSNLNAAPAKSSNPNLPEPVPLDMAALNSRTATAVAHIKAQDVKRGRGVTREAQDIFDGIARTYPARWMGTAMVVNEMVVIESPYAAENCRLLTAKGEENGIGSRSDSGNGADPGLLRIKKVLAMEKEKLTLRKGLGVGGVGGIPARRGLGIVAGAGPGLGERKGG